MARRKVMLGKATVALLLSTSGLLVAAGWTGAAPAVRAKPATWAELKPTRTPPACQDGAMAYDPATHRIVLFGGIGTSDNILGNTWTWNGADWTEASPPKSPSPRFGAAMAYDATTRQMVLFGGEETLGGLGHGGELNDTWTWNGTTWSELHPAKSPGGRAYASMAYDAASGHLVLFGGEDPDAYSFFGDTWTWNGTTWTEASASTPGLAPSAGSSLAVDSATNQLVLFGGENQTDPLGLARTWLWTTTGWAKLSPATHPTARAFAAMGDDEASSQLLLFGGGYGADNLADTWSWTGRTWVKLAPSSVPPGRQAGTIAFDASSDQLILFSGYPSLDDTWTWVAPPRAPSPPLDLRATRGALRVRLTWKAPVSDGGKPIKGYDVYEGTKLGHESTKPLTVKPLAPSVFSYTVRGLKAHVRYYFVVKAVNAVGTGAASNQASAVPS